MVNPEARKKDIAKKKELLDIMNKTGCRRGVKKEQPTPDRILSRAISHLELDLHNNDLMSGPSHDTSLPVFPTSQQKSSLMVLDMDSTKMNQQYDSEQGDSELT